MESELLRRVSPACAVLRLSRIATIIDVTRQIDLRERSENLTDRRTVGGYGCSWAGTELPGVAQEGWWQAGGYRRGGSGLCF